MFELYKEYTGALVKDLTKSIKDFTNSLAEIKGKDKQTYRMVISQQTVDRDWDVVMIDGINIDYYMTSPVVLVNHEYKIEKIAGKTITLEKVGNQLIAEFIFADTELGQLAEKLYNGWFLKASSIGFLLKKRDQNNWAIITECELIEWSLVAVGSNRQALSLDAKEYELGLSKGLIVKELPKNVKEGAVIEWGEADQQDPAADVTPVAPENNDDESYPDEKSFRMAVMWQFKAINQRIDSLADDKAKSQKDIEVKELLQTASRALSEGLRQFKLS